MHLHVRVRRVRLTSSWVDAIDSVAWLAVDCFPFPTLQPCPARWVPRVSRVTGILQVSSDTVLARSAWGIFGPDARCLVETADRFKHGSLMTHLEDFSKFVMVQFFPTPTREAEPLPFSGCRWHYWQVCMSCYRSCGPLHAIKLAASSAYGLWCPVSPFLCRWLQAVCWRSREGNYPRRSSGQRHHCPEIKLHLVDQISKQPWRYVRMNLVHMYIHSVYIYKKQAHGTHTHIIVTSCSAFICLITYHTQICIFVLYVYTSNTSITSMYSKRNLQYMFHNGPPIAVISMPGAVSKCLW